MLVLEIDGFEELLVFQVTYGGMACGPTRSTDTFAYDLVIKSNYE